MNKCVNIKLAEFKELVEQTGINPLVLSARMGVWMEQNNTDEWPTLEQLNLPNQVNYDLKLVNSIANLQRNKFESSKLQGWINDLFKQGVSKEQIDIFKSTVKDGMNKNDILTSLLASYSYTIEINTAKDIVSYKVKPYTEFNPETYEDETIGYAIYTPDSIEPKYIVNTKAEADRLTKQEGRNTQHYSNLTVPGGTNYTENRIVTPQIVPSIKGHPQFAENEDIGWFRSDDRAVGSTQVEDKLSNSGELLDLTFDEEGNPIPIYNDRQTYRNEGGTPTNTRRILEIQSDLFQKGRDKNNIVSGIVSDLDNTADIQDKAKQSNQFLQLLNKDNNWVTFFIKSIIQDSAKKGYEKVLFPKGETAAKIEGHQTIADEIRKYDEVINNTEKYLRPDGGYEYYDIFILDEDKDEFIKELNKKKSELKSQGIEKLKPIEAFYEIKVGNILEKQFGKDNVKTITDEFGNQWREIIIDQKRDLSTIKLQRINQTLSPEVSKQVETIDKLYNILHKLYPEIDAKWQDIVWNPYDNEQVRGLSNTSAGYVLISNIYENTDTLPHEYAHIYIDWYKKSPIVQQGIKLYGSEEELVQAIGENSVKALEWYHKFFQWLKSLFSKKQALLGDLTKSFLSGTALLPERENGSERLKMASMYVSTKDNPVIIPLTKNTEKLYKNFNLLNKNNQVKVFKTQEDIDRAKDWVKFNNANTNDYSFALRKTQDGYRIFVAEKFNQPQTNLHFQKIDNKQLTNLQKTTNKILERMRNRASYLEYRGYKTASEKMETKVKELTNLDDLVITTEYIKFAYEQLSKLNKNYNDLLDKESNGVDNVWNLKQLHYYKNTAESFSILDEIKQLVDNEPKLFNNVEEKDQVIRILNESRDIRDKLESGYMYHGRPIWMKWLSQFSTFIESSYRQNAEIEYKKQLKAKFGSDTKGLKKALSDKVAMEKYIDDFINKNQDKINLEKQSFINAQSEASDSSINAIWRYAGTVATSMDTVVGSTALAYYTHMIQGQQVYQSEYKELLSHIRAVEKHFGPNYLTSQREMYDFMIDEIDNTARIVSAIPYSFTKAYADFRATLTNKTQEERKIEVSRWLRRNAPINDNIKLNEDINRLISINELGLAQDKVDALLANQRSKYNRKSLFDLSQSGVITEDEADWLSKHISEIVWSHRVIDSKRFPNKKYEAIQSMKNDDPRKLLYNYISDIMLKGDSMVPESFKLNGRLPGISKSNSERLKSGENILTIATKGLRDTFSKRPDDALFGAQIGTESNKNIDILPVYFTNTLPVDEQSFDLGTIFKEWYKHNIRYFYTNQIMAELEFSKAVINNRDYNKKNSKGKLVENTLSRMWNKRNPESEITPSFIKDESSKIAAQFNDWFSQVVLEQSHKDLGDFNLFGFKFSKTKAIEVLTKYTSLRIMGLNWTSLVNNIAMAEAQQTIESFAHRYISPKNYLKAGKFYFENLPSILGDVGSDKYSSLVNQLNEHFGVFNEADEYETRKRTKSARLLNTSTLYFTTNVGEHMVQSKFLLGMLLEKRALNKDGKDIGSMLDFYSLDKQTGLLIFDPKHQVANFSKQDQLMFSARFRALSIEMHGNYSEYTKVAMQANGLSNLALVFRKWIIPTMNKRWSKKGYNEFLQDFEEGYYRTGGKYVGNKVKQFFIRWSNEVKAAEIAAATDWNTMTDFEKANIQRFATDCAITLSAFLLFTFLLTPIKNDWPKDDKNSAYYTFWANMAYQMYRFQTDQTFYAWPGSFFQLVQSPIPSMSTFNSFTKFMQDCTHPLDKYKSGRWKGEYKLEKDIYNLVPAVRQISKMLDPDAQLNALQNPLY